MTENIFERYQKQLLFKPIGLKGQQKLGKSRVGILGVGALGSNLASICARSGVGRLVLVDSDQVELSNLQRQMLFDESDIGCSKAISAADKLSRINSEISIEAFCERLDARNFRDLFGNCDLLLDGTDNFASRFILNQQAIEFGIPWIHSAVTASSGQSMFIMPPKTACLRCLIPDTDAPAEFPTVHNSGVITPIVTIIASISAATALRFLVEKHIDYDLKYYDAWDHRFSSFAVKRNDSCPHCRSF